jgi:HEAT repeat protein
VPLSKSEISKLVDGLNSRAEIDAKKAASVLDGLLYPKYGPGIYTIEESKRIDDRHFGALRGSEALDPLLESIRHGTAFASAYSLTVLGAIRDLRAMPLALDALADASPSVRVAATKCLWYFRKPSTVPALVVALDDPDPEVCRSAASALGFIGSAEAVIPLMTFYERGDADSKVAALYALGDIGDPRSLPLAREALVGNIRKLRKVAKSAMAKYDIKRRNEIRD